MMNRTFGEHLKKWVCLHSIRWGPTTALQSQGEACRSVFLTAPPLLQSVLTLALYTSQLGLCVCVHARAHALCVFVGFRIQQCTQFLIICMYSSWFTEPVTFIYDVNTETIVNVMVVRNQAHLIHEIPPHTLIQHITCRSHFCTITHPHTMVSSNEVFREHFGFQS